MAGYSGTPLGKKLGLAPGCVVFLARAPEDYRVWLGPSADDVTFVARVSARVDIAHVFVTRRADLARTLTRFRRLLRPDAVVWVSWPKQSSGLVTEVTEDVIRAVALPLGFVDVKVCAVDDTWSGLKLVVRKSLR